MKSNNQGRIRFISFVIIFIALILISRLYFLQIVENDKYLEKADRQYSHSASSSFSRGNIYFQSKDNNLISAATLKAGFTVAINPVLLKDPEGTLVRLNDVLPNDQKIKYEDFMSKALKKNDPYEEIAKRVDYETGKKIQSLNITGLNAYVEKWRFYPGNSLAANTIGFMAFKGNDFLGRYGLERYYEDVLVRKQDVYVNFFAQIFANIKDGVNGKNEGDIITSIEPNVESFFENELKTTNEKYNSEYTAGIIINPKNGEIVSMAVYPSYDLNNTKNEKSIKIFNNPLVENVYEMGSIIKPLTVSAGLDASVITASSTYNDTGFIYINNKKISNFDGKARGVVDIQTALSQSLNVGMTYIVSKLGNQKLDDYFYGFGLDEKTGIDLPNEAKNLVSNLKSPRDIEHYTASFGQGIALTPVSTVRALSTLANGGYLISPHLIKKINYRVGVSKDITIPPTRRVIKEETSDEITRMLVKSVDTVLRNGDVKMPNYSIAAKTGTAQIAKAGGYEEDQYLHSFVGYFPAYDAKFLIFLMTYKPQGVEYSSESLTDPFIDTVKFLINYYEVPPDR